MLLKTLPDDINTYVMIHKWLGFLLQHIDHKELEKLMEYYQNIGWLSAESREKLISIAEGINSSGKGNWKLPSRVHISSLLFITHLANLELPPDIYSLGSYAEMFTEHPEEFFTV